MHNPVINPAITPSAYPLRSRMSECQVLSNSSMRSLRRLCRTLAGPGKYGSGSNLTPEVMISHRQSSNAAAVRIGCRFWRNRRKRGQEICAGGDYGDEEDGAKENGVETCLERWLVFGNDQVHDQSKRDCARKDRQCQQARR